MNKTVNNYIIEYYQIGNSMKVTAVCPVTYIEASMVLPASMSQQEMQQAAIKKLEYVKSKKLA